MSEKAVVLVPPTPVFTLRVYAGKDLVEIIKEGVILKLTKREAKSLVEKLSYHLKEGYIEEKGL